MSRATLASVRIVSGLSVCALSAQAPSMDRPAVTATAAAGGTAAAVLRKLRRSILLRRSTSLMRSSLDAGYVMLHCGGRRKPQMAPALASFLLLEKRDDGFANICVLLFVKHDGVRDDRLGIGQIGIEMLLVPDEIGLGVARRVVEAHKTTGLAAIDAR